MYVYVLKVLSENSVYLYKKRDTLSAVIIYNVVLHFKCLFKNASQFFFSFIRFIINQIVDVK